MLLLLLLLFIIVLFLVVLVVVVTAAFIVVNPRPTLKVWSKLGQMKYCCCLCCCCCWGWWRCCCCYWFQKPNFTVWSNANFKYLDFILPKICMGCLWIILLSYSLMGSHSKAYPPFKKNLSLPLDLTPLDQNFLRALKTIA